MHDYAAVDIPDRLTAKVEFDLRAGTSCAVMHDRLSRCVERVCRCVIAVQSAGDRGGNVDQITVKVDSVVPGRCRLPDIKIARILDQLITIYGNKRRQFHPKRPCGPPHAIINLVTRLVEPDEGTNLS